MVGSTAGDMTGLADDGAAVRLAGSAGGVCGDPPSAGEDRTSFKSAALPAPSTSICPQERARREQSLPGAVEAAAAAVMASPWRPAQMEIKMPTANHTPATAVSVSIPPASSQSTPPATGALASHDGGSSPPLPALPPTTDRFSFETEPSTASPPPYLAAGVLPFCILGGDLLFLLGQQPRFRSRVKGSIFSKTSGISAPATGGGADAEEGEGRGGGDVPPVKTPSSQAEPPPPLRRPRRGPRLKLSALSAPLSAGSSAPGPRLGAFPGAMVLPVSEPPPAPPATLTSATEGEAAVGAEGAAPGAAECETKAVPPASDNIGGSVGVYGTSAVVQPNGWGADNPKDGLPAGKGDGPAAKPSRSQPEEAVPAGIKPQVGESDPAGLKSEGYPAVAATAAAAAAAVGENCVGRSSQMSEDSVATPGQQDMIPAGLLWSDFGGGREEGEDAEETASREFAEESFGIFHGVRLDSDSVARSQATMSSALRDPYLRGKRVFECRNGGYVMFIAQVDFVPDMMMNLARKEIVHGGSSADTGSDDAGGAGGDPESSGQGRASSPGFSEKTDFAWVPAPILLAAMRESRNRSTRKVVVKLGGCRYLRLFNKFVISLWGLDLAAAVKAASIPLHPRTSPLPVPRILLLKPGKPKGRGKQSGGGGGASGGGGRGVGGCAIRGFDCVRPSFLSGRKRTSLGIIEGRRDREAPLARWDSGGGGGGGGCGSSGAGVERDDAAGGGSGRSASAAPGAAGSDGFGASEREWGGGGGSGGPRSRSRRSGAACKKNRRHCRKAKRLRAASAAVAAAEAAVRSTFAVQPVVTAVEEALLLQTSVGSTAECFVAATGGEK